MTRPENMAYPASSSRALIFNGQGQVYLVMHNYKNPKNFGKWSTPGGRRDIDDRNHRDCLYRELEEEFGSQVAQKISIEADLGPHKRICEVDASETVTHHFYYCLWKNSENLIPRGEDHHEIIEGRFFSVEEALDLAKRHLFVLGCEGPLIEKAANIHNHKTPPEATL